MKLRKRSATLSSPKTIVPPLTPAYIASGIFKNGQWVMDAPEFESAVISVLDCRSRIDALKAKLDSAEAKIVELSEQVSGDTEQDLEINGYGFDVKIKRRNQYRWDTQRLSEIFRNDDSLPTHVKKQLSVDRKTYERLDQATKNVLRPALNVVNQKPSLNITRSN
jgi:hypothetical protein